MKLHQSNAGVFVPDKCPLHDALRRITHLGIGAHQDDLEFMAFHGITECFAENDKWFGGVTCTNGSGSARTGPFAAFTDEQMMEARIREQNAAAEKGRYGVMIQLGHSSSVVKSPNDDRLREDLKTILAATTPEVVYTHNLADKHDTHIGVAVAAIQALRELPASERPRRVWGCEVWRNLDWLPDESKVVMDVSGHDALAAQLNGVFHSQIAGGKRYDLAAMGRRAANATFHQPHATDCASQVIFGMDLTPLVQDTTLDITEYACKFIQRFESGVRENLNRRLGRG